MTPSNPTSANGIARLPLEGIRVLDLCEGPRAYCGRLLCDLGAEVVKVEGPQGESGRRLPPFAGSDGSHSLAFLFFNAGKRSATVCFEQPRTLDVIGPLLDACDVVLDDVEAGTPRVALRDEVRRRVSQRAVVWTSLTAHGRTGPMAGQPGTDLTALAHGGLLSLAGEPGHAPLAPWGHQAWLALASFGALATMGALYRRFMSGSGAVIDVSAVEAVAHSLENAAQYVDLENVVRHRTGPKTEAATGVFPCADGWVYLFTFMGGTVFGWPQLVDWMESAGTPGAAQLRAERWQQTAWRRSAPAFESFEQIFTAFSASRSRQSLFEEGQQRGVIIGAVHTPSSLLDDRALRERSFFRRMAIPSLGEISFPGAPYRFSLCDVHARGPAPRLGDYAAMEAP